MSRLDQAVSQAAEVPGVLGAVLCDHEGETVVARLGATPIPAEVASEARRHVPRTLRDTVATGEYLLRLAGAEPCALLALFAQKCQAVGAGRLEALELGFQAVGLLVTRLPEDFYLVMVLDRRGPNGFGPARRAARRLAPVLAAEIG